MARKQIEGTEYWVELTLNTGSAFTHTTASQRLDELFTVHVYDRVTGGNEVTDLFDITNNATGEIARVELNWDVYTHEYTYNLNSYQYEITHNITHNDSELADSESDSELSNPLCTGQITSTISESIILGVINTYTNTQTSQEQQVTFNDVLDVLGLSGLLNNDGKIAHIANMFASNSAPIECDTNNTELIINIDNKLYTRKTGSPWQQIISDMPSLDYDKSLDSGGVFLKCTIEKNPNYDVTNIPSWSIDYDYDFEELKDVDNAYTFYLLIQSSAGKQTITLSGSYLTTYDGQSHDPLDNDDITITIN